MRSLHAASAVLIGALAIHFAVVGAQGPVLSPTLTFEVASVKVNKSNTRSPMRWQPGGLFTMGLPIFSLVSLGYQVPEGRIVGLPDWARQVFFDIQARANRPVTIEEQRAYYRGLLEERFRFAAHVEQREMPVYALTLARTDGQLGAGLRRSDVNCDAAFAESRARAASGERVAPPTPGVRPICGAVGGANSLTAGAVEIAVLQGALSAALDRPVVDRTGLAGRFDIDFTSAPFRMPAAAGASGDLPSVFTAVQEQLGLKLEPATGSIPVLVVDRIEMPAED